MVDLSHALKTPNPFPLPRSRVEIQGQYIKALKRDEYDDGNGQNIHGIAACRSRLCVMMAATKKHIYAKLSDITIPAKDVAAGLAVQVVPAHLLQATIGIMNQDLFFIRIDVDDRDLAECECQRAGWQVDGLPFSIDVYVLKNGSLVDELPAFQQSGAK